MVRNQNDRGHNKILWGGKDWFCCYFLSISYDIASFLDDMGGIVGKGSTEPQNSRTRNR
jgi:hypothetical protein